MRDQRADAAIGLLSCRHDFTAGADMAVRAVLHGIHMIVGKPGRQLIAAGRTALSRMDVGRGAGNMGCISMLISAAAAGIIMSRGIGNQNIGIIVGGNTDKPAGVAGIVTDAGKAVEFLLAAIFTIFAGIPMAGLVRGPLGQIIVDMVQRCLQHPAAYHTILGGIRRGLRTGYMVLRCLGKAAVIAELRMTVTIVYIPVCEIMFKNFLVPAIHAGMPMVLGIHRFKFAVMMVRQRDLLGHLSVASPADQGL